MTHAEKLINAIDTLMNASGSLLCSQPANMTARAEQLEAARRAMQDALRNDGVPLLSLETAKEST